MLGTVSGSSESVVEIVVVAVAVGEERGGIGFVCFTATIRVVEVLVVIPSLVAFFSSLPAVEDKENRLSSSSVTMALQLSLLSLIAPLGGGLNFSLFPVPLATV